MPELLEERENNGWKLEKFEIKQGNFRAMVDGIMPGTYIRLTHNGDVELLDSNMVDIDKVILQCAEDYSRCVFCYDCNPYNMETEEFMNCVENM